MIKTLRSFDDYKDKVVLVRVDFNVPLKDGKVADDTRLRCHIDTIRFLSAKGAKIVLMSHLGSPNGEYVKDLSLEVVAHHFAALLHQKVAFAKDCIGEERTHAIAELTAGQILLLENTRFHPEEEKNDATFAEKLAFGIDIFINDAFATAHRAHASTEGIVKFMNTNAAVGLLMEKELTNLMGFLKKAKKPITLIIGGAKVATKAKLLARLIPMVDRVLIGGAMANTFFVAQGTKVGKSMYEPSEVPLAQELIDLAYEKKTKLVLPDDLSVAIEIKPGVATRDVSTKTDIPPVMVAVDIGTKTQAAWLAHCKESGGILWNGPVGATPIFCKGTEAVARAIAGVNAYSTVGGGDTLAALKAAHITKGIDFVSTGGGAMLKLLEGTPLAAVEALKQ